MPFFMHQWCYKDQQLKRLVMEGEDRSEVVRIAIEAFGGKLHTFYYCFGRYDGVAISSFPDDKTALACLMTIFGEGRNQLVHTTVLVEPEIGYGAMKKAKEVATKPKGP